LTIQTESIIYKPAESRQTMARVGRITGVGVRGGWNCGSGGIGSRAQRTNIVSDEKFETAASLPPRAGPLPGAVTNTFKRDSRRARVVLFCYVFFYTREKRHALLQRPRGTRLDFANPSARRTTSIKHVHAYHLSNGSRAPETSIPLYSRYAVQ